MGVGEMGGQEHLVQCYRFAIKVQAEVAFTLPTSGPHLFAAFSVCAAISLSDAIAPDRFCLERKHRPPAPTVPPLAGLMCSC